MLNKLKIGAFSYKISYHQELTSLEYDDITKQSFSQNLLGQASYSDLQIRICNSVKPEIQITNIFHEMIHCILTNAGIGAIQGSDEYEQIIECIAIGLYGVIKDNPKFRELIGNNFKEVIR
jgi:hypothetical protein